MIALLPLAPVPALGAWSSAISLSGLVLKQGSTILLGLQGATSNDQVAVYVSENPALNPPVTDTAELFVPPQIESTNGQAIITGPNPVPIQFSATEPPTGTYLYLYRVKGVSALQLQIAGEKDTSSSMTPALVQGTVDAFFGTGTGGDLDVVSDQPSFGGVGGVLSTYQNVTVEAGVTCTIAEPFHALAIRAQGVITIKGTLDASQQVSPENVGDILMGAPGGGGAGGGGGGGSGAGGNGNYGNYGNGGNGGNGPILGFAFPLSFGENGSGGTGGGDSGPPSAGQPGGDAMPAVLDGFDPLFLAQFANPFSWPNLIVGGAPGPNGGPGGNGGQGGGGGSAGPIVFVTRYSTRAAHLGSRAPQETQVATQAVAPTREAAAVAAAARAAAAVAQAPSCSSRASSPSSPARPS